MRIDKMLSESGNDFAAILICEHCHNTQKITTGYHDNYYHTKVIPAITCKTCGMNRAGEIPEESNDDGRWPVNQSGIQFEQHGVQFNVLLTEYQESS